MIVPATVLLRTKHDLDGAMRWGDVWIRDITGAAGAGSLDRPTKAEALAHITRRKGWGKMIISEYLSKETATWQAIYEDGFLVMAQGRLRHGWSFGNRTQSGVTGLTAVGETIMAPALDRLGLQAIAAVSDKPHGIYGVDFCKDKYGVWNPTEINIGRFFTTIEFFTQCGLNMPEAYLQLAFGTYEGAYHSLNKCRSGMLWVRGIDTRPTLIHKDTVPCQENASISTN